MIAGFRHRGLRRFFEKGDARGLKGERKRVWAIDVSGNWRITFRFGRDCYDVDYEDYH